MRHSYVGRKDQPEGYTFATQDYDQSQLIYVMDGSLAVSTVTSIGREARTAVLQSGSVLLLLPGTAFSLSSDTGYEGVFRLNRTDGKQWSVEGSGGPAEPEVRWATADWGTQQVAELLLREITAPGDDAEAVVETMGDLFATLAHRTLRCRNQSRLADAVSDDAAFRTRRAQRIIGSHLYSNRGVRDLLSNLGRSYRQVARDFTRILGMTPKDYQVRHRIEEAKRLLRASNLRITDIALDLGYPSSQHFAAQFRSATGYTPTVYRRSPEAPEPTHPESRLTSDGNS